ncbi:3-hydroxyacyl-ACP dehydratase [Flavobacterium columnare NBRC 100251 = ATCC 23463]|uniref:Beta-hydroxyacyl-(Acyl-carrier-protein) dehydratase, FabA/FabZ n=3 Tax=Flavobacterium TaxID=237 RepID=G8X839_FLACA|nr:MULTISPECIES: 3-hydroxyacyl-ACP dehydratase [Flavobacterium]AEW87153.1 beta-hydroxyacyl-(acyl-carrier-protein) dehydratase, FabA/FabZ [Flavobacterium columnare ATCC 49512]AMA48522.1 3-hydroxyacyl-ACP dehydratase [Flavobacterium covae]AND65350.1 3-hydroxyacyl-ACP dehydratase [Flavobacterium covae]ANO47530.1 beta-hydroxyacyl-(acyl-carrier-protein) dehydratase, FabA/FabZ [Flavobacterium columnare]APT21834.1 3-hydroxyacyl-ACP dehydratase [Flavobacterium columnare]
MLLNGFYNVNQLDQLTDNKYLAQVTLNPRHEIFKGHFPGNPVTPGVCMMQIIKELLEEILHTELRMTASSNVKFMAIINPETNPELVLELDLSGDLDTEIKVKNTTKFGDTVALKLTNTYRKA